MRHKKIGPRASRLHVEKPNLPSSPACGEIILISSSACGETDLIPSPACGETDLIPSPACGRGPG